MFYVFKLFGMGMGMRKRSLNSIQENRICCLYTAQATRVCSFLAADSSSSSPNVVVCSLLSVIKLENCFLSAC